MSSNPLDDIFGGGAPSQPQATTQAQPAPVSSTPLDDIFGSSAPAPSQPPQTSAPGMDLFGGPPAEPAGYDPFGGAPTPAPAPAASKVTMNAYEDTILKVDFVLSRDPSNPSCHVITA